MSGLQYLDMLKRNIYLLYPAGYSGSYIRWAISKSEKSLKDHTVDDPINKEESITYGSVGTSHLDTRIPTHQNLDHHLIWVIYNRPTDKKIYLINSATNFNKALQPEKSIATISRYDPDGIFICIHDDNNYDNRKYGALNTLLKWPVYFKANQDIENVFKFDSLNCQNSIDARNIFYEHFVHIFPCTNPFNYEKFKEKFARFNNWYAIRNTYNPHEVNKDTYIGILENFPNIYQISLTDIVSNNFIPWFKNFIKTCDAGDFDSTYVENFHETYIKYQPNLKWFDEIKKFRETYELNDYFRSHSLLHAFVLMEIDKYFNKYFDYKNKSIETILAEVKDQIVM